MLVVLISLYWWNTYTGKTKTPNNNLRHCSTLKRVLLTPSKIMFIIIFPIWEFCFMLIFWTYILLIFCRLIMLFKKITGILNLPSMCDKARFIYFIGNCFQNVTVIFQSISKSHFQLTNCWSGSLKVILYFTGILYLNSLFCLLLNFLILSLNVFLYMRSFWTGK